MKSEFRESLKVLHDFTTSLHTLINSSEEDVRKALFILQRTCDLEDADVYEDALEVVSALREEEYCLVQLQQYAILKNYLLTTE